MGKPDRWTVGGLFEDYLVWRTGCVLVSDYEWQLTHGDTTLSTEIKYDRRLHQTGNLCCEFSECTSPGQPLHYCGFVSSGECLRVAIGDCSRILLIDMCAYRTLMRSPTARIISTETSKAFLLKYELAQPLAQRQFRWDVGPLFCETAEFSERNGKFQ